VSAAAAEGGSSAPGDRPRGALEAPRARAALARLAFCGALAAAGAVALAGVAGSTAAAATPELNYQLNCQGCHLADGRETPGLVPGLAGSVARYVHVPQGRAYLIRLPNVASTPLSDAETAELLNWLVRRFDARELPPDFAPYTAEEVGRSRHHPLIDVDRERGEVLDALARRGGAAALATAPASQAEEGGVTKPHERAESSSR
jgi:hypothetical protein